MKRTLSIVVALLLATTLVYAGLLFTPTAQNTGGSGTTDSSDDGTATCSSALSPSPATNTYSNVFVKSNFTFNDDAGFVSNGRVEVSWNSGSSWTSMGSRAASGTYDVQSAVQASQDTANIRLRECASMGSGGTGVTTEINSWSIWAGGRRIIVVNPT